MVGDRGWKRRCFLRIVCKIKKGLYLLVVHGTIYPMEDSARQCKLPTGSGTEGEMERGHILLLDINQLRTPGFFDAYLEKVAPVRKKCVEAHKTESGKVQSLGAGVLLNKMLEPFGLNPMEMMLEYGENQKPYIPQLPRFHFNLTHSGNYAAGAWAHSPVGIDLERVKRVPEGIARRFFHRNERLWLEGLSSREEQIQGFFRLWVLKESFMKVTGLGMKLPLDAFEILIEDEGVQVKHQLNETTYYFQEFEMEGFRGAVCGEDPAVREWGIEKISLE